MEGNMESIIEFKNVTKKYDDKTAIEDISFTVSKGDIFGYLGPNGSGKTTSIRLILDLIKLTSGSITVLGSPNNTNAIRKRIGVCLDDEGFYPELTAYDNMEYFDRIFNCKKDRKKRIEEYIELVGLKDDTNEKVGDFSKGMKRRLGIARALLNNPDLLILDEPTNGLDPNGQKLVRDIMMYISNTTTIFLSSHNLDIVEGMCNKIAIINKKLLFCDKTDAISNSGTVSYSLMFDDRVKCMKMLNEIDPLDFNIIKNKVVITVSNDKKNIIEKYIDNKTIELSSIIKSSNRLENLYFSVIKEANNECL